MQLELTAQEKSTFLKEQAKNYATQLYRSYFDRTIHTALYEKFGEEFATKKTFDEAMETFEQNIENLKLTLSVIQDIKSKL